MSQGISINVGDSKRLANMPVENPRFWSVEHLPNNKSVGSSTDFTHQRFSLFYKRASRPRRGFRL